MSFSLTQELIRGSRLVAWIRGDQLTVLDFSDQGNNGALTNGWYGGKGIQLAPDNGVVTIMTGDFRGLERTNESHLISKRDAGGTNYDWRLDNTPQMEFFDGVNTRTLAHDYRGNKSLAVTFTNGAAPNGYADGALVGAFNDTVAITVDDAPLLIGNVFGLNRSMINPWWNALVVNDVMTAGEILTLHRELLRIMRGSEP
jgi:hypothetical protein